LAWIRLEYFFQVICRVICSNTCTFLCIFYILRVTLELAKAYLEMTHTLRKLHTQEINHNFLGILKQVARCFKFWVSSPYLLTLFRRYSFI
jgi:hypothetical protein